MGVEKGRGPVMVCWYSVTDVLLLLCLSGECWRLLEIVELLEPSQHWAIPTWKVRTGHSGVKQLGWVCNSGWACGVISVTFSLSVLLKSCCCVPAWPGPALPPANLSESLASCLLLLSFPKIANCASQKCCWLACVPFSESGSICGAQPQHSHGIQPLAGENYKRKYSFFVLKWFNSIPGPSVHITETITIAGTDVNFGDACSQRIWW